MPYSPSINENAITILRDLIHERTGIYYSDGKSDLMIDRLTPLLAQHNLKSFLDYYYLLKYDPNSEAEWRRVASAIAVNETYFWREYDQIQAAVELIIPEIQRLSPGKTVRIWHAGCATGEEPYTLAIALEQAGCFSWCPVEIIATDFNADAITQARAGVYRPRSFRSIPGEIKEKYFILLPDDRFRLVDAIRSRVQFNVMNLMDSAQMAQMSNLDIIFCRNVFIYFSTQAITTTTQRFYRSLNTPGYLFIAATESLLKVNTQFRLEEIGGAFVYKK